jgi:hypothetical protein
MNITESNLLPIYTIYERYLKGELSLPPHQRGDVWQGSKKRKWWKDIEACASSPNLNHRKLPGCIIAYNIPGDTRTFINDGANRIIHSIKEYIEICKVEGKDYMSILNNCSITFQHCNYSDGQEAIDHFVNINLGTTATPYEVLRCKLVIELENYQIIWQPIIDRIYNIISDALTRIGCKKNKSREKEHKYLRDSLCIFYRFISRDTSKWSPQVSISSLNPDTFDKDGELETNVARLFKKVGSEYVKKEVDNFEKFINNHYALYYQIWLEEGLSPVIAPSPSQMRWWFALAVYRKNNNFSLANFKKLTRSLVKKTEGCTTIYYEGLYGKKKSINTCMSKLGGLQTILTALDVNDFEEMEEREKENWNLKPGFVESHIMPFCEFGNGKVVPENAIDNLVRSDNQMDSETETKLDQLS